MTFTLVKMALFFNPQVLYSAKKDEQRKEGGSNINSLNIPKEDAEQPLPIESVYHPL